MAGKRDGQRRAGRNKEKVHRHRSELKWSAAAGRSNLRGARGHARAHGRWAERQDNPEDHVGQEAGAGAENSQEPEHANQRGIKIEIIGKTGTDTADLLVRTGAHEALGRGDAGRSARAGHIGLSCATVAAKLGTLGYFLLTR